ncbi:hypothetical protein [Nocardiopsis sp. CC223A]|uniref:hypothetical protein n=1 Tax=Nocardiopsis sp. CC223A TaxID=3044051 RepID=UPI00278C7666|nr:hypothetical protein [Nocardiopsis sp. CC223A]
MGVVFPAVGSEDEPDLAAVKSIRPEYAADREFRARFAGEVALARRVSGPYTARVLAADGAGLDGRPARVVMIGAGLRTAPEHTLLFERVVNLITSLVPGVVFCFNTSPDTTLDALRRWVRPDR